MTMTRDADALQRIRRGFYSGDCATVDAIARKAGKHGFAVLIGDDGSASIVPLGKSEANVRPMEDFPEWFKPSRNEKRREESTRIMQEGASSYEQVGGEVWERAKQKSHEPGEKPAGRFNPVQTTGDAARLAKQAENSRKERDYRADAIARNEAIAKQQREFWNKRSA